MGSGAVFFDLLNTGRLTRSEILLCDVNPDLIGCYWTVRDRVDEVIREEVAGPRGRRFGSECCYEVRDRQFNPARAEIQSQSGSQADVALRYTPALAAMLIFLNRTGFNGLFRVNRRGGFNVPAGSTDPRICDEDHIRAVGTALDSPRVSIRLSPFDETMAGCARGDFVYCDPPYAPLSRTSSFAHYTAGGFTAFDQLRLQRAVIAACSRGARVVVSNSSASEILKVYTIDAQKVQLKISRVPARRAINSRATSRGPVDELIISNVLDAVRPRMVKASRNETSSRRTRRTAPSPLRAVDVIV